MSSSDEASSSLLSIDSPPSSDSHSERLSDAAGVHSFEDSVGCEESDGVCCNCSRLVESVRVLERALADRDRVISELKEENRRQAGELLEIQLRELQQALSDKDSAIATLEHQLQEATPPPSRKGCGNEEPPGLEAMASLVQLRRDRASLRARLKAKVKERLALFKKDSEEAIGVLASQHRASNKKQVCNMLRSLERSSERLKAHIDQLFAVVLEQDPVLMEGLPRIQQDPGLDLDLLSMASMTQLLDELSVKEQQMGSLQSYADLLVQRITDHDPDLINSMLS